MPFKDISIKDFKKQFQDYDLIIDIRDKDSFNRGNIANSINYNSQDIMSLVEKKDKGVRIMIYCYHGNSSRKVALFLSECGFKDISSLIGGFSAWEQ